MSVPIYTRQFDKQLDRLSDQNKRIVQEAICLFLLEPRNPLLRNHKLHGKMDGFFALYAGYDLRIIYTYENSRMIVVFVAVGKHDEVYT